MPEPLKSRPYHILLNQIQRYSDLRWKGQTVSTTPISSVKLIKVNLKPPKQYEHDILIYCILNAKLNIILLYWNKQHFESGIIKWGCRLFDQNFHLVPMFTCFRCMQICIELNVESSGLHFSAGLSSTCLRSRHLHVVERYTGTKVFWISCRLVPPHFGDWHYHLDQRHRSESSDHRIWWKSQWRAL